ncbi:hypothetical protein PIB30_074699 [Stylosanthes scabra]|uniref:Uncharacterized protein n=1 Tax=Stylosanthes scabra TaxID=79078 RepID=A0ABU6VQP1_9FABA|nr:hypothetical protein [Stylosanthes scabra]
MAPAPVPGPVCPIPRTPMCDAGRYRSLFSRHRVTPPTPPPPSPPSIDDEPSAETYDPAAELEGDPDEPYVVEPITLTPRTNRSARARVPVRHRLATILPVALPGACPWVMNLCQADRQAAEHQTTIWVSLRVVLLSPVHFCESDVVPVALVLESLVYDSKVISLRPLRYDTTCLLIEKNAEEYGTGRNNILMVRRLKELEQRVKSLA